MRRLYVLAIFAVIGCSKPADPVPDAGYPAPTASNETVAPIGSGAAGSMTPVTGSEGAGMGGIGQSMKDKARSVGGSSSADQATGD